MKKWLLCIASWISQKMSKVHMPYSRKLIVGKDFHTCQKKAKAGMLILSRTNGELSNPFIPGFWSHVGMITSDGKVIESVTHGVQKVDLFTFFLGKDFVCLLDPNFLTDNLKIAASGVCEMQEGKQYDFMFATSDIKKFYCSELVYFGYKAVKGIIPFKPKIHYGQEAISTNDYWEATQGFNFVWASEATIDHLGDEDAEIRKAELNK